jgi:hypothetical protein
VTSLLPNLSCTAAAAAAVCQLLLERGADAQLADFFGYMPYEQVQHQQHRYAPLLGG